MLCKPHKSNGLKGSLAAQTVQEKIAREQEAEQIDHYYKNIYLSERDMHGEDRGLIVYWDWDDNWEEWQHTWSPSKK